VAALTQVRETARFLEASSRPRMLAAEAAQVTPDGIMWETIRRQPYAPVMASAHGSVLADVDGDERTGLLFNHTALVHGHGYSPVPEAVARQSRQLEAMPFPSGHVPGVHRRPASQLLSAGASVHGARQASPTRDPRSVPAARHLPRPRWMVAVHDHRPFAG